MNYRFDEFEVDTGLFELRRAGAPVPLEPQVFSVLAYLVEHADRVVLKTELLDAVWGDRFISDAALTSRLMAARKALGDSGQEQRYIKTVHRRGYRFAGEVAADGASPRAAAPATGRAAAHRYGSETPEVRYARASDGANIAFWAQGAGYPLIHSTGAPFNHVQREWSLPDYAMWFRAYEEHLFHVRYDGRGSGLSGDAAADYSIEAQSRDIIAVADRLELAQFALQATQATTLAAVHLAATQPARVSHLVIIDGYTNGREYLRLPQTRAFQALMEADWPLFTETLARVLAGDWSAPASEETASFLRECVSQENCVAYFRATADADVTGLLGSVSQPTLVLHHKRTAYPAIENAQALAAGIADARLVLLDGTWQDPGGDIEVTVRAIESLVAVPAVRLAE